MHQNDFEKIKLIVSETLTQALETRDFNLTLFIQRIEQEFTRVGLRVNLDEGGVDGTTFYCSDWITSATLSTQLR